MQGRVNYTVVGIFVVVLTAFLSIAIVWMSTASGGKEYRSYLVFVREDVTGLSAESPVRFNGVKVGYVDSVSLDADNPKLVRLKLAIAPNIPITTSTYAILNAQGVTGIVYVNLKAGTETAPLLVVKKGEPYPVIPSRPSLLMQLSAVLPEVAKQIQNLSGSVSEILDVKNRESIRTTLKNMAKITQTVADNSADFTDTMKSLDNALANMSEASNSFPETIKQLKTTLASVDALSNQMHQTASTINNTMQSGQLVIHNFSDQVMPSAQQALSNLSRTAMSMQNLTEELQQNPSVLVRGRAPAQPGPGEK